MPVETLFISGPPQSGKTTVARLVAEQVVKRPVHYVRMAKAPDEKTNSISSQAPAGDAPWASIHQATYTADRIFETLPEALRAVRRLERRGFAIVEADADPGLRHAYPYDHRIFVMGAPASLHEVFRDSREAARALREVMQDTASFASEIFGLFDAHQAEEGGDPQWGRYPGRTGQPCDGQELGDSQVRQFLRSPLGTEIAARIQLQPEYYALVESDAAIINTGGGRAGRTLDECVRRLEKLLARVRYETRRQSTLYCGDLLDAGDPGHEKLLRRLQILLTG